MTARLLIFLLFFSSCLNKSRIPGDVIKPDQMQNILRDILKADALAQEIAQKDTTKDLTRINIEMYNTILRMHSVSAGQFDSSFTFYEKNPAYLLAMFDTLNQRELRNATRKSSIPVRDTIMKE